MGSGEQRRHAIGAEVAIYTILGFWLFYVVVVSLRGAVMGFPSPAEFAQRRAAVTVIGIGITYLLYMLLRQVDGRPLGHRVAVAFLGAVPASFAIALFNYWVFNIYDPTSLFETSGIGPQAPAEGEPTMIQEIVEFALTRYFFLIAWAGLYLAISFAAEVREAERRAAAYARAAQEAEIRSLRYQVNPHFLFNTLNSLSALVMTERATEAETMIMNLSTFFRTSLASDPTEDVVLAEEVRMQRLYLDIEAVRFRDRLRVEMDLAPGLERACVPALILQPLVENAIKYGVSPLSRPVTIRIAARTAQGRLTLTVTDDGLGEAAAKAPGERVGLANVRDRLVARYGPGAGVVTTMPPGGGFVATLTLPEVYNDC
ncbi:two-component sensor histidine kinase [Sphingomonas jejuensis]|uniref:Two-component sensor histidine kinase n=1 Tax=Sphingomonas jejuensis TaxID=904715 RepID=A0ABX0XMM9_9SPHN|nr:histidine kinase [Sphingomonas jejuensis]NJC34632.1 two-component sensor histidine kinase [Sphingomonas jejuensis]